MTRARARGETSLLKVTEKGIGVELKPESREESCTPARTRAQTPHRKPSALGIACKVHASGERGGQEGSDRRCSAHRFQDAKKSGVFFICIRGGWAGTLP